ncbi:MAG: ABC transporter permease [Cytophagales bacterium]|nr:ABC transporter permease [Cytophagales bacterium]
MSKSNINPPPLSLRLVRKLVRKEMVEEIEGNLYEYFDFLHQDNRRFLLLRYWLEVVQYFRPAFLKMFKLKINIMFFFNPKIAARNLLRHRSSTVISLLGFTIGLTSVLFLYFYIENELTYDDFHADKDQIFKVYRTSQDANGDWYDIGVSAPPYAAALKNDFPGTIKETLRYSIDDWVVTRGESQFYENRTMIADTNFFEFFSYPLIQGDPETVLDEMANVVLSEELAKKYFGDEDPVGQNITLNGQSAFVVAGVFGKPENKTHLDFDMVLSMQLYEGAEWFQGWWRNFVSTYVKINPVEAPYLSSQFEGFMEKYLGEDFKQNNNKNGLKIVSLNDIYFHKARYDDINSGSKATLWILGSVAIAILFIACFNYINLSIAQSYKRSKEVGIRKVLGVDKSRLIGQFMGESLVLVLLSMTIAILLSVALQNTLNTYFQLEVNYRWHDLNLWYFFGGVLAIIMLTSGLYPALLLSSFDSLQILKNNKPTLGRNIFVRKGLIIAQFTLSVFLLVVTMLIYVQLQYMNDKDLGYDATAVLVIDTDPEIRAGYENFRNRLLQHADIRQVTVSSGVPGGFHDSYGIHFVDGEESVRVNTVFADPYYLDAFDIQVVAGRGFDDQLSTEQEQALMINESALKATGLNADEIIGKTVKIPFREWDRKIVGVYKDYHFKTLKDEVAPQAIIMGQDMRRISIKMNERGIVETLSQIELLYGDVAPSYPMKSWMLEQDLEKQYEQEDQQAKVFSIFSMISIGLACMGIFGLAAFSAQQRQKELSIRKVLGASVQQVILLISKEFLLLVSIAILVAIPMIWKFMENWLSDFAYRIQITDHLLLFILGGIITALVAFVTIGLKTYRTASVNPAETIRQE